MSEEYLLKALNKSDSIRKLVCRRRTESLLLERYKVLSYYLSGQIVISYLSGYSCDSVNLNDHGIDHKNLLLNYQADSCVVKGILDYINNPEVYYALPENDKKKSNYIAHRVASIIVGGPVALAIYKNGYEAIKKKSKVVLEKPDLEIINEIQYFLAKEKQLIIPDFSEKLISYTLDLFHPQVWTAVESLARKLTKTQYQFKLNRKLIENNLYKSGLISYKESIRMINCD
jgi:hypothetical protein